MFLHRLAKGFSFSRWTIFFGLFSILAPAGLTHAVDFASTSAQYYLMKTANKIIQAADYLPFTSLSDGCYARAFYIGMELAARRIPSKNLYIMGSLRPEGAQWKWHVAPALKLASIDSAIVFDPALSRIGSEGYAVLKACAQAGC